MSDPAIATTKGVAPEHATISINPSSPKTAATKYRTAAIGGAILAALMLLTALIVIPIAWTKTGIFKDKQPSHEEIAKLFDTWNSALQTGDPKKVASLYAKNGVLLPTVSNVPRTTPELIEDYFVSFLKLKPFGRIDRRFIHVSSTNVATDSGLYTFTLDRNGTLETVKARYTFEYQRIGGHWKIIEHHSSALPEQQMLSETEVAALFDKWNAALKTLDPVRVAALYGEDAVLIPTVSNLPRSNRTAIMDYFGSFLKMKPQGTILEQHIMIPASILAIDAGVYVFNLVKDGKVENVTARYTFVYKKYGQEWLIAEHHSSALPEQKLPTEGEIKSLFVLWNNALQTLNPETVADRYADDAILLPTLSNKVRTTRAARVDYFKSFLKTKPQGKIIERHIEILSPTVAMDDGIYEFTFKATNTKARARYSFVYAKEGGKWLIKEHHSSKMPEE